MAIFMTLNVFVLILNLYFCKPMNKFPKGIVKKKSHECDIKLLITIYFQMRK